MPIIDVNSEVNKFFDESSESRGESPKFVLITGVTGAGKTTLRREKYKKGYVNLDAADIYISVGKGELFEVSEEEEKKLEMIGSLIAKRAIAEKRNIVTEIIGASQHAIESFMQPFLSIGYKTELNYVDCDPVEAYKRHYNAVQTDKTYMSSYYCQYNHRKWILDAIEDYKTGIKIANTENLLPKNQILRWEELSNVAKEVFNLSSDGNEIKWAEKSWQILNKAGLTSCQDKATRLKVILRFFALAAIYYDFFSIIMEESEHEVRAEEWLDDLDVHLGDIRLLEGAAIVDDVEPHEVLASLIDSTRREVYNVLLGALGDVNSVFIFLYRAVYPTNDESDTDILNDVTGVKGMAFGWIEQGCEKYG